MCVPVRRRRRRRRRIQQQQQEEVELGICQRVGVWKLQMRKAGGGHMSTGERGQEHWQSFYLRA
jgi:hypothetical protein